MPRKYNFYAGPATLPYSVLEQIQSEIIDYKGEGLSMIETSHRSKMYDTVHNETIELLRELMGIPENYHVLFLGGGATLQFAMVPMNLMRDGKSCDFIVSGSWAQKAIKDAQKYGEVRVAYDGSSNSFTSLPSANEVTTGKNSAYLHLTSNETIGGVQWKVFPKPEGVPVVADMSSDILSRPVTVSDFGIIYAGAQKNMGPAGVTVVIIRDDLVQNSRDGLPAYLSYKTHADKNSLYNTPPVFSIYAVNLVLKWIKEHGGVESIGEKNEQKADAIYQAIERNGEFYSCPVDEKVRSTMNVVFRLPTEDLEKQFIKEAEGKGMLGLKGHRSVGGCRASLYNAMPLDGAQSLAAFMDDFARKHG
jgi:phosphoserine aminotransferase